MSLSFDGSTLATPTGGYATQFSFQAPGLPGGNLDATFTFVAASSGAAYQTSALGSTYDVQPVSGSFSFVYSGSNPLTIGSRTYGAGTVLLAGDFSGSDLYGADFGSTASLTDSRLAGGTVNFSSGISQIEFSPSADESLSLALNSIVPFFGINGPTLSPFTATSTGTFAADVTVSGGAGVPEAGAWVTLILGCALAGAGIRSRRVNTAKA